MAIIKLSERTVSYWRRERVGCKRSAPNRENAPPVKKTKTKNLSSSHQKKQEEMIPYWEEPKNKATAENAVSVSAQENWSMSVQYDTCETYLSAEGGDAYHPDLCSQYNTIGNRFSAQGGDSYLPDLRPHFLAEGGDSYHPCSCPHYNTAEGSTKNAEASEAESQVDRWACRVCKVAAVSIVVLPCSHLCLCWECETETESCPICGEAKTDCFYTRND